MHPAARLVNVDVGVKVITVQVAGFDNHRKHDWDHGVALGALDKGVRDFYSALDDRLHDRVTVMTFSEFGRRPEKNGSLGTDHGAASVAMVIGNAVSGGLYGTYPSLTDLDRRGNLKTHVDFRSLYGTVVESWLGADGNEIVGGSFEGLALFGAAPDGRAGSTPPPVVVKPPTEVARPAPAPVARQGYLVLTESGEVHNFGKHSTFGSAADAGAVAIRRHPTGDGYWVVSGNGAVWAFGDARYFGGANTLSLKAPIVGMAPTDAGSV